MTQITVKSALDAWRWVLTNDHHEVGTQYSSVRLDEKGVPLRSHVFFRNHRDTMRVPDALCAEVFAGLKPNPRPFDTRMFALRPKALRAVKDAAG